MRYILFIAFVLLSVSVFAQTVNSNESAPKTDSLIFRYVEQMPQPTFNMNEYLAANLNYPKKAINNNIEGRVTVNFIVNTDGSISNPQVVGRRIENGELLEEEAIRVIKNMPKWKPGKQNGRAVRVYYTQPVMFKLTN